MSGYHRHYHIRRGRKFYHSHRHGPQHHGRFPYGRDAYAPRYTEYGSPVRYERTPSWINDRMENAQALFGEYADDAVGAAIGFGIASAAEYARRNRGQAWNRVYGGVSRLTRHFPLRTAKPARAGTAYPKRGSYKHSRYSYGPPGKFGPDWQRRLF